jgi:hypothetical protein
MYGYNVQTNRFTHSQESAPQDTASKRRRAKGDTEANMTRQACLSSQLTRPECNSTTFHHRPKAARVREGGSTPREIVEWINCYHHNSGLMR